jgi:uncharacterized protein (TIGR00255 family)
MKSMTGFGRSHTNQQAFQTNQKSPSPALPALDISVKAVNGRYLDLRFHLPREYAPFESELKSMLTKIFTRGTIDVYVNRTRSTTASEIRVNTDLARKWYESYQTLNRELHLKAEPSFELFTRIPELFEVQSQSEIGDEEKALVRSLLEQAARGCDQERLREGKALASELENLCGRLEQLSEEIVALKSEAVAELERRLRDRLQEHLQKLGFEGKVDDQRIAQEIVIHVDRADISEELTRLREHLKAYRQLLKSAEPQGKKLDFYAQELLREVNTIGSKSHIAKLTAFVVEAKSLVEKIREQVQNVE